MSKVKAFCPPWSWWIRTGERMLLGLDVRTLLNAGTVAGPRNKKGLSSVLEGVEEGQPLISSMKHSGMRLSPEIWCLLETGEVTGRLGEAMKETGRILEHRLETRREIIGQIWYPALVLGVGFAVMTLILLWVVPQMREASESMGLGEEMPWLTEHIGWFYGAGLAGFAGGSLLLSVMLVVVHCMGRRSLAWASLEVRILRVIPGIGKVVNRMRKARILRQLGTLVRGGVTLPGSLEMAADSVSSKWIQNELLNCRSRLLLGSSFKEAMESCGMINEDDLSLLMAGQESGQLDVYLLRISSDCMKQVSWSLKSWTRFLEPVMLLGLSIAIGGLVLAYLLPMVRMIEQAGGTY